MRQVEQNNSATVKYVPTVRLPDWYSRSVIKVFFFRIHLCTLGTELSVIIRLVYWGHKTRGQRDCIKNTHVL